MAITCTANVCGHIAPASDGDALVECLKEAIANFGEAEFAQSLAESGWFDDTAKAYAASVPTAPVAEQGGE